MSYSRDSDILVRTVYICWFISIVSAEKIVIVVRIFKRPAVTSLTGLDKIVFLDGYWTLSLFEESE